MTAVSLADEVAGLVEGSPAMTFAELQNRLGARGHGERTLYASLISRDGPDLNAIIWLELSESLMAALGELFASGRIHMHPTPALTYAFDGAGLDLPVATSAPRNGFKTPHWVPVVLNPGPPRDQGGQPLPQSITRLPEDE